MQLNQVVAAFELPVQSARKKNGKNTKIEAPKQRYLLFQMQKLLKIQKQLSYVKESIYMFHKPSS